VVEGNVAGWTNEKDVKETRGKAEEIKIWQG
jgi:hypothetical protein